MPSFKRLEDLDVKGKRVLVRADLNVPVRDGKVSDTTRIDRSAETVRELAQRGACVVVCSHFGRPKGTRVPEMSLRPVVEPLALALGMPVAFAEDCVGPAAELVVNGLAPGQVALLENLRFHAEEEKNDPAFAQKLAALCDLYVNDAFSSAHRAHASTEYIARLVPCAAGRLMQAELEALGKALESPERPVAAVVGGAKVSTKLELLGNLVTRVDRLIIGGGMANTFLYAQGIAVGVSLCERDMADTARAILDKAAQAGCTLVLPVDAVVAREFKEGAASEVVSVNAVPADAMILDVGPASIEAVKAVLASTRTLVWNGPMGAFEIKPFDAATNAVAQAAAEATRAGTLLSVAGGGDTVAALANAGVLEDFTYVSTAGGAFLEWLEGKTLPGVAALEG
ncbi:phosphoglycerate kinase [Pararhodospirillum photometricum]|uniref:Phosphoglycerate kinase n=1 Tax=Pararhodospirillum photometricum DSM 122 TaxID=1150469 RepID=H6SRS7_PARPM|nr:phosphoglycerate kinase [Pararhodospirillum photometricum]CCG07606.1 Phosphoglycerate kinase [Pararhodospirillum photometricum DSM 122]